MPAKKKTQHKPRRYRKKRNFNYIRDLPSSKGTITTLKYCDAIYLPTTNVQGTVNYFSFNSNGAYLPRETDPSAASFPQTHGQPYGFDQWMPFYNHFTVLSSKIKVTAINSSADACMLFLSKNNETTSPNPLILDDPTLLIERGSKYTPLPEDVGRSLTAYWSAKKDLNVADPVGHSVLKGSLISNPTEKSYFTIGVTNYSNSTVRYIQLICEIHFRIAFSEPKKLPAS